MACARICGRHLKLPLHTRVIAIHKLIVRLKLARILWGFASGQMPWPQQASLAVFATHRRAKNFHRFSSHCKFNAIFPRIRSASDFNRFLIFNQSLPRTYTHRHAGRYTRYALWLHSCHHRMAAFGPFFSIFHLISFGSISLRPLRGRTEYSAKTICTHCLLHADDAGWARPILWEGIGNHPRAIAIATRN